ncbi:MAG: DNA polymerase III subunit delta [Patescibacteria group bacterium]
MIIFIYGDDALRVKERALDMRQKFTEKFDAAGMNVDEFVIRDGFEAERGAVIGAAQASPFLSEKRMVIVRGLVSSLKKAESKPWVEGFSRTPSSTILIFADAVAPATLEKSEIFKALKDIPDVYTYPLPQLEGGELTTWAMSRAKFHGAILMPAMLSALLSRTGADSWRIDAELQKLAAYANGIPIDQKMITELVRVESQEDIFAFMDALSSGQSARALGKLAEEREAGADEFQLFGMLLRQIRLLIQARDVVDRNPKAMKQDIADALSIHPFVAQKLLTEVRAWSQTKLESLHGLAFKLDKSMKTGLAPDISVDRLVSSFLKVS